MKKALLLLISAFSITLSFGQKSSPVVGDAAALIDLLNKDYNTVNPDTWDEEINTDRGKVIAIFKSYLEDRKKKENASSPNIANKMIEAFDEYMKAKEAINAVAKVTINVNVSNLAIPANASEKQIIRSEEQFEQVKDELINLQNKLRDRKYDYYQAKNDYDNIEFNQLEIAYAENDYLKNLVIVFREKFFHVYNKTIDNYAENNTYSSIQKSIPFIGGDLSFETIIDGLSRFLAKRIKEELTIHAIDKIKNYLENPTPENYCHELLVLLPSTTNYLKSFESNQLLNFTDEMKQYIEQDLNDLLTNAVDLKNTPRLKRYIEKYPDLEFAFEGLEIIPQLSKIKSPVDYFEIMENSRCLARWRNIPSDKTRYNIAQAFRLASMIAYSMTVVDNGETKFASVDMVSNYGNEINFFYLYFGMLHQQNIKYFNVSFVPGDSFTPMPLNIDSIMLNTQFQYGRIETLTNLAQFLKSNLTSVATNAEKVYAQALTLKKKNKNNEEIKYDEVYSFIDDFISFAEEVVTTSDLFFDNTYRFYPSSLRGDLNLKAKLAPYFNVSRIANNMMLDLHQKKYSNAIIKAIEIPLSFNMQDGTGNGTTVAMLQNVKTAIEGQQDLGKIKKIFIINLVTGSDDAKMQELKKVELPLEIVLLKLDQAEDLGELKRAIKHLRKSISEMDVAHFKEVETEYYTCKSLFEKEYKPILNHYGINTYQIVNTIKNRLNEKNKNAHIVAFLEKRFDKYTKDIYCKVALNQDLDVSIEEELESFINEFVTQTAENERKVNDNNAIKVIHFVNEMAGAKDAEEVEKAITAFALPVGSSSLKEKALNYFSINAYPGLIGGLEFTKGQDDAFSFGFTAPVGLYAQFCSWGNGNSLGAFVPIIDIGAPVRLRIDSDSDNKTLPDFNFNDIFSPGFYLSYGFGKKLPLAINLGAQYGPKLRDVDVDADGKFDSIDSYRISVALVIDIPLFTISGKY